MSARDRTPLAPACRAGTGPAAAGKITRNDNTFDFIEEFIEKYEEKKYYVEVDLDYKMMKKFRHLIPGE